jgi:hypothetical protein
VGAFLPPPTRVFDKTGLFARQIGNQVPGCGRAIGSAVTVDTQLRAVLSPYPHVREDPQASMAFAQMPHFLPAIALGLDAGILREPNNVAPAKPIQITQKWVTHTDVMSYNGGDWLIDSSV